MAAPTSGTPHRNRTPRRGNGPSELLPEVLTDLSADALVGVEVECESSVVFLDDSASTLLDSLRTDTL